MTIEIIKIPQDNVNDEVVLLTNVHIKDDQKVDKNTLLVDYETSKANFEIKSNSYLDDKPISNK